MTLGLSPCGNTYSGNVKSFTSSSSTRRSLEVSVLTPPGSRLKCLVLNDEEKEEEEKEEQEEEEEGAWSIGSVCGR